MSGAPEIARGWQARLALGFEAAGSCTRISRRAHCGPLLVQRAFYPESQPGTDGVRGSADPCHVYLLHPPGGIVSGDELELDVEVDPGAHALLTTPAAGKFYRRAQKGQARVHQTLRVGGTLEWLPQENIFYPDAAVELRSIVHLSPQARFIGWEIGCLGLPASGRGLDRGILRLSLELWQQQRPLLLERLFIDRTTVEARWGLAGHTAFGTALVYPAGQSELEQVRSIAGDDCAETLLACTLVDGVLVCRATARRTDHLKQALVRCWQMVRPAVLARAAVKPRIWST